MKTLRQKQVWKRAAVSAVIAYALVLQAVLVSFTGAAHAATQTGPAAILCDRDGAAASHDRDNAVHHGVCCILGATAAIAAGGAPVDGVALIRPIVVSIDVVFAPEWVSVPARKTLLPVGSRAPPRIG